MADLRGIVPKRHRLAFVPNRLRANNRQPDINALTRDHQAGLLCLHRHLHLPVVYIQARRLRLAEA